MEAYTSTLGLHTADFIHITGTWSVHSFNGDYLSIPESTGSCGYLSHDIPGTY